jgi:hypothetical protein
MKASVGMLWLALVVIAGAGGATSALATIPDAQGVIHACYKASNGVVDVIDDAVTTCGSGEVDMSWNIAGPAGPQGPVGPAGAQGPTGPQGSQGTSGPSGPQGRSGAAGPAGVAGPAGLAGPAGPNGSVGPQGAKGPGLDFGKAYALSCFDSLDCGCNCDRFSGLCDLLLGPMITCEDGTQVHELKVETAGQCNIFENCPGPHAWPSIVHGTCGTAGDKTPRSFAAFCVPVSPLPPGSPCNFSHECASTDGSAFGCCCAGSNVCSSASDCASAGQTCDFI